MFVSLRYIYWRAVFYRYIKCEQSTQRYMKILMFYRALHRIHSFLFPFCKVGLTCWHGSVHYSPNSQCENQTHTLMNNPTTFSDVFFEVSDIDHNERPSRLLIIRSHPQRYRIRGGTTFRLSERLPNPWVQTTDIFRHLQRIDDCQNSTKRNNFCKLYVEI